MRMSDPCEKVAAALLKAQRAMPAVKKTAENPHFHSKFAPLDAVMDAALAACNGADLSVLQSVSDADDSGFTLDTTLLHTSGQYLAGGVRFPLEKGTPQATGSSLTYARRYSLCTVLGIVGDDDEDGEAAEGVHRANAAMPPKPVKSPVVKASLDALAAGDLNTIPDKCPNCGGPVWDNRTGKKNPKAPDWKCRRQDCTDEKGYTTAGWLPKGAAKEAGLAEMRAALGPKGSGPGLDQIPTALDDDGEPPLPF